jgi:Uma2 family endonuclease
MITHDARLQTVVYPESDGEPVGETDDHRELMFVLIFALKNLLRRTAAYVAGNLFIYYEEGHPESVVAPDVFVIFGVPQHNRRTYKTWEHGGKCPDLVIELTSSKTRYVDLGEKRVRYAELGVQEYYIFDPLGEYLEPRLRGYQLVDGELLPLPGPRMFSRLLNAELRVMDNTLRLYDMASGTLLPTPYELDDERQREAEARQREAEARQREAEARQREAEARRTAEAEVERLRAEIERLRAQH